MNLYKVISNIEKTHIFFYLILLIIIIKLFKNINIKLNIICAFIIVVLIIIYKESYYNNNKNIQNTEYNLKIKNLFNKTKINDKYNDLINLINNIYIIRKIDLYNYNIFISYIKYFINNDESYYKENLSEKKYIETAEYYKNMIIFYLETLLNNTNDESEVNIINTTSKKILGLLNCYINDMSDNSNYREENKINSYNYFYF